MTGFALTNNPEADTFLLSGEAGFWKDGNFEINQACQQLVLPIVEVGGPTPRGYQWVGESVLQSMIISNICVPKEIHFGDPPIPPRIPRAEQALELIADAHTLPFVAETVGAVFASAFPETPHKTTSYRAPMIDEATRVLQPGGLLIMQSGNIDDIRRMTVNRLDPKLLKVNTLRFTGAVPGLDEHKNLWTHTRSLFVFQKPR